MKNVLFILGLAIVAIVIVVISSTVSTTSNNQTNMEREQTERLLAQEETKQKQEDTRQQAQELRAQQTNQTTNLLSLIIGGIVGFGFICVALVFLNDRFARNRIHEMQVMAREERLYVRELKQLELLHQKQLAAPTQWYLTGNANYGENKERQIVIYEDDSMADYK